MNPENIPFNTLIIEPTNSGKTKFLTNLLSNEVRFKFDYITLLCLTVIHNRTYEGFAENDQHFLILTPPQMKSMIISRSLVTHSSVLTR